MQRTFDIQETFLVEADSSRRLHFGHFGLILPKFVLQVCLVDLDNALFNFRERPLCVNGQCIGDAQTDQSMDALHGNLLKSNISFTSQVSRFERRLRRYPKLLGGG